MNEETTGSKAETVIEEAGKEEFVSKKAYGEVSSSMHKYKSELKDTRARLNELEEEKRAAEKEALAEQGKWEELYNKNQEELTAVKNERANEQDKFVDYHKKNSVLNKVGGFKRDEYNKFIDVNAISMNEDGSIDNASLELEIDRIRQTYPELLKEGSGTKLPNSAPQSNDMGTVDASELSGVAKNEYFKNYIKNNK
jgi:chromosome segregation ATPase